MHVISNERERSSPFGRNDRTSFPRNTFHTSAQIQLFDMTVLLCSDINLENLGDLLGRYGMKVKHVAINEIIPGSFWQPPEAGLVGNVLYVRDDTPVHSALHEACHYICMDKQRREKLDTDAGGDYEEENGVCYLQILLADHIAEMGRERMFSDMDAWGYSFRLGSSKAWFEDDAEDAANWLAQHKLVDELGQPVFHLRQ
jgi:hypothetical protein